MLGGLPHTKQLDMPEQLLQEQQQKPTQTAACMQGSWPCTKQLNTP